MREHNERLERSLMSIAEATKEQAASQASVAEKNRTEERLKKLMEDRVQALSDGEWERVNRLDAEIMDLKIEALKLQDGGAASEQPANAGAPQAQGADTPELRKFYAAYPWANPASPNYNPQMLQLAAAQEVMLLNDPSKPLSQEAALMEAGRIVSEKFGIKPLTTGSGNGTIHPEVEPPTGGARSSASSGKIRLTAEQIRMATALMPDIPKEEAVRRYARQLAMMGG